MMCTELSNYYNELMMSKLLNLKEISRIFDSLSKESLSSWIYQVHLMWNRTEILCPKI